MPWFDALYALLKNLHPFMTGATFALSVVAALLFLRYYRKTGERLFLFFSAAFAILGLNRLAFAIFSPSDQEPVPLFVIRLIAFCLIIFAILDKNRTPRTRRP